jgi:hypothetical protein
MMNRPEFIIFWLGMAKIGVVTSFLNHNLRGVGVGCFHHNEELSGQGWAPFGCPIAACVHQQVTA